MALAIRAEEMVTATLHQLFDISEAATTTTYTGDPVVVDLRARLQRWLRIATTKTTPVEAGESPISQFFGW